jgi:hypothetical protein
MRPRAAGLPLPLPPPDLAVLLGCPPAEADLKEAPKTGLHSALFARPVFAPAVRQASLPELHEALRAVPKVRHFTNLHVLEYAAPAARRASLLAYRALAQGLAVEPDMAGARLMLWENASTAAAPAAASPAASSEPAAASGSGPGPGSGSGPVGGFGVRMACTARCTRGKYHARTGECDDPRGKFIPGTYTCAATDGGGGGGGGGDLGAGALSPALLEQYAGLTPRYAPLFVRDLPGCTQTRILLFDKVQPLS